jgi:hypothetical protein
MRMDMSEHCLSLLAPFDLLPLLFTNYEVGERGLVSLDKAFAGHGNKKSPCPAIRRFNVVPKMTHSTFYPKERSEIQSFPEERLD